MDCPDIDALTCVDTRFIPMDGPCRRWYHKNYPRYVHHSEVMRYLGGWQWRDCIVEEMAEPSLYSDLPRIVFSAIDLVDAPHRHTLRAGLQATIVRLCTVGAREKNSRTVAQAQRYYEAVMSWRADPQARDDYDQGI